jgi:pimeloyl-ACP methyl ester carboxylesterase
MLCLAIGLALAPGGFFQVGNAAAAMPDSLPPFESRMAELGDIHLHYLMGGAGAPIVFLHGGFGSSAMWEPYFARFADAYTVIAPDSRGQGQTSLGNGPISYGRMAADFVRLLDHLGIDRAHFVGHSDGGCTTLHLLVDYPDRVLSATLLGTPYHIDNYRRGILPVLEEFARDLAESDPAYDGIRARHAASRDPERWSELVNRLSRTWLAQPTFSDGELGLIETPVLVVKVDRDPLLPAEVFDRMAELIRGARVLYLPEGTHSVAREQPERIAEEVRAFIESRRR